MFSRVVASLLCASQLINAVPIAKNPQCPDYCRGTVNSNSTYVCGDPRLGPVDLPSMLPLSNSIYGYDRFGGQCPGAFLENWYNGSPSNGSYIYPPSSGFQLTTSSAPLSGRITLPVGLLVDRFGNPNGSFLAAYGTPFDQRAIPPANLDTFDGKFPYNYYVFEVLKPFEVTAGPIAGWFDQPGQGSQYVIDVGALALVGQGALRQVSTSELTAPGIGQ